MLTAEQLRAARAMLRMDQEELARRANVSVETIKRLEALRGPLSGARAGTLDNIQRALEAVEFTNGDQPGVRMKQPASEGRR